MNLTRTFEQADYLKWRTFRDTEDARFVGLTLPHVLMRLPYGDDSSHVVDDKDKSAEGSIREENERYKDVVRSPGLRNQCDHRKTSVSI